MFWTSWFVVRRFLVFQHFLEFSSFFMFRHFFIVSFFFFFFLFEFFMFPSVLHVSYFSICLSAVKALPLSREKRWWELDAPGMPKLPEQRPLEARGGAVGEHGSSLHLLSLESAGARTIGGGDRWHTVRRLTRGRARGQRHWGGLVLHWSFGCAASCDHQDARRKSLVAGALIVKFKGKFVPIEQDEPSTTHAHRCRCRELHTVSSIWWWMCDRHCGHGNGSKYGRLTRRQCHEVNIITSTFFHFGIFLVLTTFAGKTTATYSATDVLYE